MASLALVLSINERYLKDFESRTACQDQSKHSPAAPQSLRQLQTQITNLLTQSEFPQGQAQTIQDLLQGYIDPLPTVYSLFYAVAILVALVGLLSLAFTLITSVLERRMEIGILRSLGATSWRVGTVFWIEGLTLAVLAWAPRPTGARLEPDGTTSTDATDHSTAIDVARRTSKDGT